MNFGEVLRPPAKRMVSSFRALADDTPEREAEAPEVTREPIPGGKVRVAPSEVAGGAATGGFTPPVTWISAQYYEQEITDSAGHTLTQRVYLSIKKRDAANVEWDDPTPNTLPTGATEQTLVNPSP